MLRRGLVLDLSVAFGTPALTSKEPDTPLSRVIGVYEWDGELIMA